LHKCHENVAICVLKLVVADCYLVSINVATGSGVAAELAAPGYRRFCPPILGM